MRLQLPLYALILLLAACQRTELASSAAAEPVPAASVVAPPTAEDLVLPDPPAAPALNIVDVYVAEVARPVVAMVDAVTPPPQLPPPPVLDPEFSAAAAKMIARWEITSQSYYNKRLKSLIWPRGASGLTWCIGYDGGHQNRVVILDDWRAHDFRDELATTAGIRGNSAKVLVPKYQHITTEYPYCIEVFKERTLVSYDRTARRAFPGYDDLRLMAKVSVLDLVYNRGTCMTGDRCKEMRKLRDECIPNQDYACMAAQYRSMKRIWKGTPNEPGLSARREAEAKAAEEI